MSRADRPDPAGPSGSPLDRAALEWAALRALSAAEEAEFASATERYGASPDFEAEVASLRTVLSDLASGEDARPTTSLWPRVLERVRSRQASAGTQVWTRWAAEAATGECFVPSSADGFEPTDIEGVTARRLRVGRDDVTMLVRMAPGTAYPAHRHAGPESCFVLEGSLDVGPRLELGTGDFQHMPTGSVHPVQSTRDGCLLFLVSSRADELLLDDAEGS